MRWGRAILNILTPVWGGHVGVYLDVALPALLAHGNIPSLGDEVRYVIYTSRRDRVAIEESHSFKVLCALVDVSFEPINEDWLLYERKSQRICTDCYTKGIQAANGEPCVFLCPDLVFADGSLANMARIAENHDVIFTTGIRTKKKEVIEALMPLGTYLSIKPRELMRIALDNLHPLAHNSFFKGYGPDFIPANLYWAVGDEGIVARCYHLHPLFVRPQVVTWKFNGTIDIDYFVQACPDASKDYVVTDSDEILAIELSPPSHYFTTTARKGSREDIAKWAKKHANRRHRMLFEHAIKMHTGMKDEEAWAKASAIAAWRGGQIKEELRKLD